MVETVLGFGSTILAVALGARLYPLDFLLPVLVPVNLLLSTYIAARHHRHIQWAALGKRVLPLLALGLAAGLTVFTLAESRALQVGYGLFVVGYAGLGLAGWFKGGVEPGAPPPPAPAAPPQSALPARASLLAAKVALWLVGAGFFQGLYAAGGPILVYYANREFETKGSFRSTLSAVWALLSAAMVAVYWLTGKITPQTLATSAELVPVLVAAIVAGERLHVRTSERAFRLAVLALLLVAGLSFLVSR